MDHVTETTNLECVATQAWLGQNFALIRARLEAMRGPGAASPPTAQVGLFMDSLMKRPFLQVTAAYDRLGDAAPKPAYALAVLDRLENGWKSGALGTEAAFEAFSKLQRLLQIEEAERFPRPHESARPERLLLVATANEKHTHGVKVMADHLQREGIETELMLQAPATAIVERLARQHVDVLGISVGTDVGLLGVADLIVFARRQSTNGALRVMVGGQAFEREAEEYDFLNADLVNTTKMSYITSCKALGLAPATAGGVGYG